MNNTDIQIMNKNIATEKVEKVNEMPLGNKEEKKSD